MPAFYYLIAVPIVALLLIIWTVCNAVKMHPLAQFEDVYVLDIYNNQIQSSSKRDIRTLHDLETHTNSEIVRRITKFLCSTEYVADFMSENYTVRLLRTGKYTLKCLIVKAKLTSSYLAYALNGCRDTVRIYNAASQLLYSNHGLPLNLSNAYRFEYTRATVLSFPEFLNECSVGIICFNNNKLIIKYNKVMQKYITTDTMYIQDVFPEHEQNKIHTLLHNGVKERQLFVLHDLYTRCMVENLHNTCIFYFDDLYNYGYINFTYQQRMIVTAENIGGALHDMNNLATVLGANLDASLPIDAAAVNRIRQLSTKMTAMLFKLLSICKNRSYVDEIFNVDYAVCDFISTLGMAMVQRHRIQLKYKNLADNLSSIKMCPILFEQILANLISNSIDAINARTGIVGVITVTLRYHFVVEPFWTNDQVYIEHGKYVELCIRDNGIGITKEHINLVFKRHFTTKKKNTGFGLHTVCNIMKRYNGFVNINSVPLESTCIFLYIPQENITARVSNSSSKIMPFPHVKSILFVDDNQSITDAYRKILFNHGFIVSCLSECAQVLKTIERNNVDTVILDFHLPDRTGPDMGAEILRLYPNMQIIYTSGMDIHDLNVNDMPNVRILQKPFSPNALLGILKAS
jgi:CheY-like chemotaxis protein